nr:MAG TPA: hypothetical protein [Caudoviricetes sp.]
MITKEKFNELKFEKKKIYYLDYGLFGSCTMKELDFSKRRNCGVCADHFPIPDEELEVREFYNIQDDGDCDEEFVCYLKDCYETQEDAEFAKEFKNIKRTEILNLPTFEELKKFERFDFKAKDGHRYTIHFISGFNTLAITGIIENKYYGEATKENYLEACKIAKNLFLGENDEQ